MVQIKDNWMLSWMFSMKEKTSPNSAPKLISQSFFVNDNVKVNTRRLHAWALLVLSIPLLFFLLIFPSYFNSSLWFSAVWQRLPLGEALLILKDSLDKDSRLSQSQQSDSSSPPGPFCLLSHGDFYFFNLHMTAL